MAARSELVRRRASGRRVRGERGQSTAEYATGTVAACAIATILIKDPALFLEPLTEVFGRLRWFAGPPPGIFPGGGFRLW